MPPPEAGASRHRLDLAMPMRPGMDADRQTLDQRRTDAVHEVGEAMTKVTLTMTETGGTKTKVSYTTNYPEASTQDAFNALYRAQGMTEFIWMGEPEQADLDYMRSKYGLS